MSGFDLQRLGQIMEPEPVAEYEWWPDGRGGYEDARITFVERLRSLRNDLHRPFVQGTAHRAGTAWLTAGLESPASTRRNIYRQARLPMAKGRRL